MFKLCLSSIIRIWIFYTCCFLVAEQTPSYTDIEDDDIEEEFKNLELTVGKEAEVPAPEKTIASTEGSAALEASEILSGALSNLKLSDSPAGKPRITQIISKGDKTANLVM